VRAARAEVVRLAAWLFVLTVVFDLVSAVVLLPAALAVWLVW
jgi:hypothetical protein